MNTEKQRIAIAEACGWKYQPYRSGYPAVWIRPDGFPMSHRNTDLPNYPADLNAMHEAEKVVKLSGPGSLPYRQELEIICHRTGDLPVFATAAQRAEAFLRTINKWEEDQPK